MVLNPQLVKQEREHVGILVDGFVKSCAHAMAGAGSGAQAKSGDRKRWRPAGGRASFWIA